MGDHWGLAVQFLLGQDVHNLLHAAVATDGDAAESLALAVSTILVELNLDKVRDTNALDSILDVLVRGPPGEVADIQLVDLVAPLDRARARLSRGLLGCSSGRGRFQGLLLGGGGRDHVVEEVGVLLVEVIVGELGLDVCV